MNAVTPNNSAGGEAELTFIYNRSLFAILCQETIFSCLFVRHMEHRCGDVQSTQNNVVLRVEITESLISFHMSYRNKSTVYGHV